MPLGYSWDLLCLAARKEEVQCITLGSAGTRYFADPMNVQYVNLKLLSPIYLFRPPSQPLLPLLPSVLFASHDARSRSQIARDMWQRDPKARPSARRVVQRLEILQKQLAMET